jgi:hypothetical protein
MFKSHVIVFDLDKIKDPELREVIMHAINQYNAFVNEASDIFGPPEQKTAWKMLGEVWNFVFNFAHLKYGMALLTALTILKILEACGVPVHGLFGTVLHIFK